MCFRILRRDGMAYKITVAIYLGLVFQLATVLSQQSDGAPWMSASEESWNKKEHCVWVSGAGSNTVVNIGKLKSTKSIPISHSGPLSPVCYDTFFIIVAVDGAVQKYDYAGTLLAEKKLDLNGAVAYVRKFDSAGKLVLLYLFYEHAASRQGIVTVNCAANSIESLQKQEIPFFGTPVVVRKVLYIVDGTKVEVVDLR